MKSSHWIFYLVSILLVSTTLASEMPGIYRVPLEARDLLVEIQATVRHGKLDGAFVAELTEQQVERLKSQGYIATLLYTSEADEAVHLYETDGTDEFHSYADMRTNFMDLASANPDIAQFEIFGSSVQNRDLFGLKISANPTVEENEPEVVFWGCIHGNEYGAAEMPYLYAIYLCDNYGVDPQITEYIDNNEIWCIPIINPDGRVNGTRNNANGIDLNRDFGYNWDSWGGSQAPFSQVESRTVREFLASSNAVLSISFHCSGDEFYYPWGYFPHPAPDHDLLVRVGERYADMASYNLMSSFNSYQTHGEILDWAYGCFGSLSYTAEVSNSSSNVQVTFDRNRPGMDFYCSLAAEGLHGTITDATTGEPLQAAVWIQGNPIPVYSDPLAGDVHRVVLPGTYNLTIWANGYQPQDVNDVIVAFNSPGQFDVALQPGTGEYAFQVTSVNQDDPNNAYNNKTFAAWALGAPDNIPCSLGSSGFIVLDMGAGHSIVDGPGDDFTVTEVIHPRDPDPEAYRVYAGDAYVQDILIGNGLGTTSFDLTSAGVTSTRYLKIVDASGSSPNFAFAGMDLDGITVLNSASQTGSLPIASSVTYNDPVHEITCLPNPFNPTTVLSYELRVASSASLKIFDIQGRGVATLVDGFRDAGHHEVTFDGSGLASGVYLYRLQTAGSGAAPAITTGKMVLMK